MGVSRTQVVKFIRKGDTGDKGEQGAVLRGPQAWSDCATGYAFQAGGTGEKWQDVVIYGDNYYSCKKSHTKTASNYPGSTTDTNNGYWQLGDKIELVATKILLATYALVKNLGVEAIDMKDANGNILFQAKDGAVTCKTGTFENVIISGTLKGVSGSFKSLDCIDNKGKRIGGISFNSSGQMTLEGDIYSQGYDNEHNRGYRFYSSSIWCRGQFGAAKRNALVVKGSYGYYCPKGIGSSDVYRSFDFAKDSNSNTYYKIPMYGDTEDYAGMPVDIVVFAIDSSSTYYFQLTNLSESQRILVINANDNYNNVKIYSNGTPVSWNGGEVAEVVYIPSLQIPSVSTSVLGRGLLIGAFRDNNW